jgi:hypothetical protein
MAHLIDQIDATHAARAPRRAADFVHELDQYASVQIRSHTQFWVNAEMQHRKPFMRRAHENGNADRTSQLGNGEEGLHSRNVADANSQPAIKFVDFRDAIGIYGLLNSGSYPMLVYIEEQQLLERCTLLSRQVRCDID